MELQKENSTSTNASFNTTKDNKPIILENKFQYYQTINKNNGKSKKKRYIIFFFGVIVAIIALTLVLFLIPSNDSESKSETNDSTLTTPNTTGSIIIENSTNIDSSKNQQAEILEQVENKEEEKTKEKVTEIEIIDDKKDNKTTEKLPKKETTEEKREVKEYHVDDKEESQQIVEQQTKPEPEPESNSNKIFTAVEQKPQFPGGDAALLRWLSTHIQYPLIAQEEGAQGRVIVQFVVEKDGRVGQTKIARGRHPALDQEALRLVKSLPRFTPGYMNGTPVRCWFTLPVTFKLQN